MSLIIAYIGIIIFWSTTPLAIKLSGEGVSFLFGVSGRMVLSLVACLLFVKIKKTAIPFSGPSKVSYFAAALGLYGAMLCTYWGAQFVPSGFISVIFGLTPIVTGVMAAFFLHEQSMTPGKLAGIFLGIIGLAFVFFPEFSLGTDSWKGILAILMSVFCHSLSTVWVKKTGATVSPLAMSTGGLSVATPLFLCTWFLADGHFPDTIPLKASLSIVYLGAIGAVATIVFYYLLKNLDTGKIAIITLITPVMALLIGQRLNGEVIFLHVWIGTGFIIIGLILHSLRPSFFFKD